MRAAGHSGVPRGTRGTYPSPASPPRGRRGEEGAEVVSTSSTTANRQAQPPRSSATAFRSHWPLRGRGHLDKLGGRGMAGGGCLNLAFAVLFCKGNFVTFAEGCL